MMKITSLLVITLVLLAISIENTDAYYKPVAPVSAPASAPASAPLSAPPPLPPSKHLRLRPGMPAFCPFKCAHRCSKNPRDLCKKLCMHCCNICKCVPTGPTGDRNKCPCYRDMKGRRGNSKCP